MRRGRGAGVRGIAASDAPMPEMEPLPARGETTGWVEYRPALKAGRVLLLLAREEEIASAPERRWRMSMEAADLSLLKSGRVPLILDHMRAVETLAGVVEEAWIDDGRLFALARLAGTPRMAEVRRLLRERVIRNCSMGLIYKHRLRPEGDGVHIAPWWRPYEVSLVACPAGWLEAPALAGFPGSSF